MSDHETQWQRFLVDHALEHAVNEIATEVAYKGSFPWIRSLPKSGLGVKNLESMAARFPDRRTGGVASMKYDRGGAVGAWLLIAAGIVEVVLLAVVMT